MVEKNKYELSGNARNKLNAIIANARAQYGAQTAAKKIELFEEEFERIAASPSIGTSRPKIGDGCRSISVGGYYVIVWSVENGMVLISDITTGTSGSWFLV